jgi:hypothetical protein
MGVRVDPVCNPGLCCEACLFAESAAQPVAVAHFTHAFADPEIHRPVQLSEEVNATMRKLMLDAQDLITPKVGGAPLVNSASFLCSQYSPNARSRP